MSEKSIRSRVEAIKRQQIASKKIVNLSDFRNLSSRPDPSVILVVDDDEVMRSALKRILEAESYNVVMAEDGLELSKVLESRRLDMILLDVNLPWVDGYELCRMIKSHHGLRGVPLVLVSGRKNPEDVERGINAGADAYITKPFEVDQILQIVQQKIAPQKDS